MTESNGNVTKSRVTRLEKDVDEIKNEARIAEKLNREEHKALGDKVAGLEITLGGLSVKVGALLKMTFALIGMIGATLVAYIAERLLGG